MQPRSIHPNPPGHVRTQQEGSCLQARKKGYHQNLTILASWSQTFQLPELWEINVCCLSHPTYGILLYQPELTKTEVNLGSSNSSATNQLYDIAQVT